MVDRRHVHWDALSVLDERPPRRGLSPGGIIKGNVSRKGERIYHLAGGLDYVRSVWPARQALMLH